MRTTLLHICINLITFALTSGSWLFEQECAEIWSCGAAVERTNYNSQKASEDEKCQKLDFFKPKSRKMAQFRRFSGKFGKKWSHFSKMSKNLTILSEFSQNSTRIPIMVHFDTSFKTGQFSPNFRFLTVKIGLKMGFSQFFGFSPSKVDKNPSFPQISTPNPLKKFPWKRQRWRRNTSKFSRLTTPDVFSFSSLLFLRIISSPRVHVRRRGVKRTVIRWRTHPHTHTLLHKRSDRQKTGTPSFDEYR